MGAGTASEISLALKAKKTVIFVNADSTAQAFFKSLAPAQVFEAAHPLEAICLTQERLECLD